MLRAVLSSLSKTSAIRPFNAVQANLAYSTSPKHGEIGDINFYEMVELFFDRAGKFFSLFKWFNFLREC